MKLTFLINKKTDLVYVDSVSQKRYMETEYKSLMPVLQYTTHVYQKAWDEINDPFSALVEKITEVAWKHKKYKCIVSVAHPGISNWNGANTILRWWKEHPYLARRITAHELVLHHHFRILNEQYANANLSDKEKWALSEIAAFAITGLTNEAKRFWPWDKKYFYDTHHNYPSIVPLQKKLKQAFLKRKNYDAYILAGIRAVKSRKYKIDFF